MLDNNKSDVKKKIRILNIVIVIMALLVVFWLFVIYAINMDESYHPWTTKSFIKQFKANNYYKCVEYYYANEANGYEPDEEVKECYAVTLYYEASYRYKIYSMSGEKEKAEEQIKKKQDNSTRMGSLSAMKKQIDEYFIKE